MSARGLGRFKAYQAYKDSGVEWLGEIPAGWGVKRLWHLTPIDRRIMYGIVLPGPNVDDGVPIVKGGDVSPERLRLDRLNRTTREIESGYVRSRLRGGDLVYAIRGSIGEVAIVPDELDGANLTQDAARIAYTAETHGAWLLHALKSTAVFAQLEAGALGATIRGINIRDLKRASLPLPPPSEQRAIAAFLDRETARIDGLVAKKERLIDLLQEKRTALITRAVTKGLDPNVPMKDSGVEWLEEIPAHWNVCALKRTASIRYGLGEPPRLLTDGLPFVRATNVTKGRIADRDMQFVDPEDVPWNRDPALLAGDIIVVRSGAYTGDSAIIPQGYEGAIAGYDMVVRVRRGWPQFLAWALLSRYVLEAQIELESMRAAQPHLNAEELGAVTILLPPDSEQFAIVTFLEWETSRIDALIAKVHDAIDRLKELRTALISAAVTGKIDVREVAA